MRSRPHPEVSPLMEPGAKAACPFAGGSCLLGTAQCASSIGWWAASNREQSEPQLGALDDVRATPVRSVLVSNAGPRALRTQPEVRARNRGQDPDAGGRVQMSTRGDSLFSQQHSKQHDATNQLRAPTRGGPGSQLARRHQRSVCTDYRAVHDRAVDRGQTSSRDVLRPGRPRISAPNCSAPIP